MGVGSFILPQIEVSNEWQRPSDWLPMPTNITETDQIFLQEKVLYQKVLFIVMVKF